MTLLIVTAGTCVSRAEPTAYRETGVTRTVFAPGSRSRDGPRPARPGPASSPTAASATAAQTPGLEFSILPPTPLLHSEPSGQARPPPPSRRRRDLTRTRVPIVLRATVARPILNRGAVTVLPVFPPSQFSCHCQSHPSEARGSRRPGLPRLELAHTRRALREGGCEEALAAPRSPRAAAPSPVVGRPVHSPAYRGDTVPAVNRNLTSGTMKVHRNLDFVFRLITIDIISIAL